MNNPATLQEFFETGARLGLSVTAIREFAVKRALEERIVTKELLYFLTGLLGNGIVTLNTPETRLIRKIQRHDLPGLTLEHKHMTCPWCKGTGTVSGTSTTTQKTVTYNCCMCGSANTVTGWVFEFNGEAV